MFLKEWVVSLQDSQSQEKEKDEFDLAREKISPLIRRYIRKLDPRLGCLPSLMPIPNAIWERVIRSILEDADRKFDGELINTIYKEIPTDGSSDVISRKTRLFCAVASLDLLDIAITNFDPNIVDAVKLTARRSVYHAVGVSEKLDKYTIDRDWLTSVSSGILNPSEENIASVREKIMVFIENPPIMQNP